MRDVAPDQAVVDPAADVVDLGCPRGRCCARSRVPTIRQRGWIDVNGPMYESMISVFSPMMAGPRMMLLRTTAPASTTTLPFDLGRRVHPPSHRPGHLLEDQAVGLQHVLDLAGVLPPPRDEVGLDLVALVHQVLDGVGDLQLAPPGRPDRRRRPRRCARRTCRRRPGPGRSSARAASRRAGRPGRPRSSATPNIFGSGTGVSRIRRVRLARLELLDERRDAALEDVVAQVHDERSRPRKPCADQDGVGQAERRRPARCR